MPALGVYRKRPVRPTRRQSRRGRWVATKAAAVGAIAATSPVATQFRRGGGGSATMPAAGTYSGGTPTTIRYRLDNGGGYGAYQVCDAAPAGGTWSGSITLPASELDYTVEFSWGNDTSVTTTVAAIANLQVNIAYGGQSNEAGRGTSNQTVRSVYGSDAHRKKTATGYAVLADPAGTDGGSGTYAVHEANILGAALGHRIGIVNFAVGGTPLSSWQTAANGGSGNYEALKAAVNAVGGCDILRMGPCETDAINGTTQAAYHAGIVTFVASWQADFPSCKITWRTLQHIDIGAAPQVNQDAITGAVLQAAGSIPGKATGDVAGVYLLEVRSVPAHPGDQFHWTTDQQLADVGGMAAAADYAALNPTTTGGINRAAMPSGVSALG